MLCSVVINSVILNLLCIWICIFPLVAYLLLPDGSDVNPGTYQRQQPLRRTRRQKHAFIGNEKVKKEKTFPAERVAPRDDPRGGERFQSLSDELYPATYHTI